MKNNRAARLVFFTAAAAMLVSCSAISENSVSDRTETYTSDSSSAVQTVQTAQAVSSSESEPVTAVEYPQPDANTYSAEYFLNGESDAVRKVYRELYEGLFNYSAVIDITDGVIHSDNFGDFLSFVNATSAVPGEMDSSYRMYVDDYGFVTKIEPDYAQSREEGARQYNELMEKAQEIVSQLDAGMTDYEKIKFLHDAVVSGCIYDDSAENAHSAYGCLVDGRGVCESYAKAFSLLCELSGIDSLPVLGSATDEDGLVQSHMWNKVLVDGLWYNIDCTWDDPTGNLPENFIQYDYFFLSDADISLTHSFDYNFYMTQPSAWDGYGTYFDREGLVIDYYTDVKEAFSEQVGKVFSGENDDGNIRFRCSDEQVYGWVNEYLFGETDGEEIGIKRILHEYMSDGQNISYSLIENDKLNIITVRLNINP